MLSPRMAWAAVAALAMTPALFSQAAFAQAPAAAAPATPSADLAKFAGVWAVTAAELGGEKADELVGATFTFTSETATFAQKTPDGMTEADNHPFKVDPTTRRILIYQQADSKEGLQKGLYQFSQAPGTLFLCLTPPDSTEFPKEFKSKTDTSDFLMLKLERPKK